LGGIGQDTKDAFFFDNGWNVMYVYVYTYVCIFVYDEPSLPAILRHSSSYHVCIYIYRYIYIYIYMKEGRTERSKEGKKEGKK
jgi:hypothetical protein